LLVCLPPLGLFALAAASCGDGEALRPLPTSSAAAASFVELGPARLTLPSRALPGAVVAATVTAINASDGPIRPGEVTLGYQGSATLPGATLTLAQIAAPGAEALFTGTFVSPSAPGRYPLAWQARRGVRAFGPVIPGRLEVTCSDGVFCNGEERFVGGACVRGKAPCDDGQACTDDACDEARGACAHVPGAACAACAVSCAPICAAEGRACGPDGCGGLCGACEDGERCVLAEGACRPRALCDHDRPACAPGCPEGAFCGVDCACHPAAGPLPDLVIRAEQLAASMKLEALTVSPEACVLTERCVFAAGERRVLRLRAAIENQGRAALALNAPDERPELFDVSACDGHPRLRALAVYALLNAQGEVVRARDAAACVADAIQATQGPSISCEKRYTCTRPGLQAGWVSLDEAACDLLDVTDLPPGDYDLRVTLNPERAFEEASFDNNVTTARLVIP
jgi:Lysyl oxidase